MHKSPDLLALPVEMCISASDQHQLIPRTLVDLERYFCRELGFALLVLALASVLGLSADGDDTRSALSQLAETATGADADNSKGTPVNTFPAGHGLL